MLERAHLAGLLVFALLLGLFEGPAEIAGAFALLTFFATRRFQGATFGAIEVGLLIWLLSGAVGVLRSDVAVRTETLTRPMLALAYFLGKGSVLDLDARGLSRMAWLFGGAIVFNGAYGLLQVFGFDPPLETLIIGRQKHGGLIDPENSERLRMATGLFYNRLKLAHLGIVGLSLFVVLAAAPSRVRRLVYLGIAILGAAVFFSYRRAAPLSLVLALATFGLSFAGAHRKRWLMGAAGAGLVVVLGLVATATGRQRLFEAEAALLERFEIYGHALALWKQSPWFGIGHGHYRALIPSVTDQLSPLLETSAHGWFLETLVETGIVGATGFLVALGSALVHLTRRLRASNASGLTPAVLRDRFTWIALVSFVFLGLAHSVLYHRPVALAFWVLLGVAAGPGRDIRTAGLSSSVGADTRARG